MTDALKGCQGHFSEIFLSGEVDEEAGQTDQVFLSYDKNSRKTWLYVLY